eukprot:gene57094-biopygen103409
MGQRVDYCTAVQYERCRRLPEGNRARAIAEQPCPSKPKRRSWRKHAREVLRSADLDEPAREPLATHAHIPPWEDRGSVDFRPELDQRVTRKDPPEKRKAAAIATLAKLPRADIEAYTDGSVLEPRALRRGGGGYTLVDSSRSTHTGKCAAGRRCTSFRAEISALIKCLDDLIEGKDDKGSPIAFPQGRCHILIALDSQSAIKALLKGPS